VHALKNIITTHNGEGHSGEGKDSHRTMTAIHVQLKGNKQNSRERFHSHTFDLKTTAKAGRR